MRDYGKIAPQFWTGETGKKIKASGPLTQVIACHLLTCPSSSMLGLYYLPLPTLCHETGSPLQGARKALRCLSEAHFAYYDEPTEFVYVPKMARYQIAEQLEPKDKRVVGITKYLRTVKCQTFVNDFIDRYRAAFHLHDLSPLEGPSKPLRSQEQEQEQEQEDKEGGVLSSQPELKPEDLRQMWNALPGVKPCKRLGATMKESITSRLRAYPTKEFWAATLEQVQASHFLTGKTNGARGPFQASLDWTLKPVNFDKLLAGNYDNAPDLEKACGCVWRITNGRHSKLCGKSVGGMESHCPEHLPLYRAERQRIAALQEAVQ